MCPMAIQMASDEHAAIHKARTRRLEGGVELMNKEKSELELLLDVIEEARLDCSMPRPAHAAVIPDPVSIPSMAPKQKDLCKFSVE